MMDVKGQLYTVMIVYLTLLGDNHPFVIAYTELLNKLESFEVSIIDSFSRYHQPDPILWVFLRFIQIKIHQYWEGAKLTGSLSTAPDFASVIDEILEERTSWCARMPLKYWAKAKDKPTSPLLFPGTMWQVGGGSVISGLTSDETKTSEEESKSGEESRKIVVNPSNKFAPYREAMKKLTLNVIRNDPTCGDPPKTKDNGQEVELCASYHIRGSCFANCRRKAVHRPLTPAEEALLLDWCKKFQAKHAASS